ncbi:phage tail protein [Bacillus sp. CH30_1T]|uniref:phage tail protein n=1 Tax=Bacillus sp. CH30_1T TaxID=2604836 RepID=UPI0021CD2A8B|nr:phage tail protein [Bacillus sp. CH30_1T]
MYKVSIKNDGTETVIHNPNVNNLKLASGSIRTEINKVDSFNFSFYMNNPGYGKIKPLKTLINVLNMKTGKYEFEGRVLGPSDNMDSSGLINSYFECEGELGYLHDSQQRHLEFRGTPKELLQTVLEYHNSQVEDYKHFHLGEMNVTNSTNYIYLYLSAEQGTLDIIEEKLLDKLGGELQIRKVNGVRFLDYLISIGEDKNTEIRMEKNLVSMSKDVDTTEIVTRLTPLGARIKSENENSTDASQARVTIEEVNNGLPYLDDEALIKEFGIQGGSVIWDDVTISENLKTKGLEWINKQKTAHVQYQINAIDLSLIGLAFESFERGDTFPLINPVMCINERLRVIGKTLEINSPQDTNLTIGDKFKTLNEYQSDVNKSTKKVLDLENTVGVLTERINSWKFELL